MVTSFASCSDDDDSYDLSRPTALVTVCPNADGSFVMNLDKDTKLFPTNLKTSPFGKKEVRALVNYTEEEAQPAGFVSRNVKVNWIDSIRTKEPVKNLGELNDEKYGNDPLEIVADWMTVAEDGYLTLRIRTLWGSSNAKHAINLVYGVNPSNPNEFELRHDANGDTYGHWGDALIAFNLNDYNKLPNGYDPLKKFKLKWKSFQGEKSLEFEFGWRSFANNIDTQNIRYSGGLE